MRLIFAGSGEFGAPTLRALLDAGHEVVQVVSQPDRPAGRGRHLTPTPISQLAIRHNLPLVRTAEINSLVLPEADLLVVIAFGQKIAPVIAAHARLGSINLHGSRLPEYRGAAPINAAILNGATATGNSIIRIAERMDAGAILAQSRLEIGEFETAGELHDRLAADGAGLVLETIGRIERVEIVELEQDDSKATRAPKLGRQSAHIDWTKPAAVVARQIRGMYPWPGCHVRLLGGDSERGRVLLVRARSIEGSGPAGAILENGAIAAGAGAVEITELQPEGKRPMPLLAFRNGHPWQPGMRLESM